MSDSEHPNSKLIRDAYAAFARQDFGALRKAYFAEDVVWHHPGRSPISGDYHGMDELFAFFGKSAALTAGSLRLTVEDVLANDNRAVATVQVHAERNGRVLDERSMQLFAIRNGRVAEVWTYPWDVYAQDEFYA